MQVILATFGNGPKYFISLDLFSGYYQIGLTEQVMKKTAFIFGGYQYVYIQIPFRLCNTLATFQKIMNQILVQGIEKFLIVYIDNIIIYSNLWKEYLEHVQWILQVLH